MVAFLTLTVTVLRQTSGVLRSGAYCPQFPVSSRSRLTKGISFYWIKPGGAGVQYDLKANAIEAVTLPDAQRIFLFGECQNNLYLVGDEPSKWKIFIKQCDDTWSCMYRMSFGILRPPRFRMLTLAYGVRYDALSAIIAVSGIYGYDFPVTTLAWRS